ncbi:MAG TPA: MT-A70 family methyltransferase [Dongiaceae bacterium]|nr:MT-A70 family methyltransferase [Dongiaceae bacterium]
MRTDWPFGELQMFGFDLVMIDIPWSFETWSDAGKREKSPESHYETMTLDEIRSLPVMDLFGRDGLLWAWATHPMIDQQIDMVKRWGFKFVTTGVWVKRTRTGKLAFGTGYRLRCASEPFIIATTGSPVTSRSIRTVIEGPIRDHSRKPDEAYREAEKMMPNARRADVFARQRRSGWAAFGNEIDKFKAVA